jgi:hypothetical protein
MVCGVFLWAAYNAVRFDNPFEFGLTYNYPGLQEERQRLLAGQVFSIDYVGRNLYHLILLMPTLSLKPPYVIYTWPDWLVGEEYPKLIMLHFCCSLFFSSPLLLCSIASFKYATRKLHTIYIVMLVLLLVATAVYPLLLLGYARRYVQDYYPYLVALAYLGFVWIWKRSKAKYRGRSKGVFIALVALTTAWTFMIALNLNIQFEFSSDFCRAIGLCPAP